jgi:hypothetical protein
MGSCKHGENCKFLHEPRNQMGYQPQMMMSQMPGPIPAPGQGASGAALQAYAAQAQELANQFAMQAQAYAAQAAAQGQVPSMSDPMGAMPGMPAMPAMSAMTSGQESFGMVPSSSQDASLFPATSPGFSSPVPMGTIYGMGTPGQPYAEAMPGAQAQAMMFAQQFEPAAQPPAKRRRSGGTPAVYTPSGRVCDFFYRMGECRHGENCKFEHIRPDDQQPEGSLPGVLDNNVGIGEGVSTDANDQEHRGIKRAAATVP